jgi:hypothetical protein
MIADDLIDLSRGLPIMGRSGHGTRNGHSDGELLSLGYRLSRK